MVKRYRRLKNSENIRKLVRGIHLNIDNFIYPLFIIEGDSIKQEIPSMPGQYRFSLDMLDSELDDLEKLGIRSLLLFGIPEQKDDKGTGAYDDDGIVQKAIRKIKSKTSFFTIITDVCMCEYTSHGHCGILDDNDIVKNDITVEHLGRIALSHARSGADIVAPSDMMDFRVSHIRSSLDSNGFSDIPIMAYSIKYSSAFYGPFRDAADSAPSFGDRQSYQMDYRRKNEGIMKAVDDIEQGADIVIVKPATSYLDIIQSLKNEVKVPIAAYHVSGEYAMIKAAGMNGWIDERRVVLESMTAIKRAGATIIITYFAKDIAKWL